MNPFAPVLSVLEDYLFRLKSMYILFRSFISSRVSFGGLCLSRNWSISSKLSNLWELSFFFIVFLAYSFNFQRIHGYFPSLISDISN